MSVKHASLGHWKSPITSELITSKVLRLSSPSVLPNGDVLWLESRPSEQGRSVIVRRSAADGAVIDITPGPDSGLNVRTRVHEYGGGEHLVTPQKVFFSNFASQRVHVQDISTGQVGAPSGLTAKDSQQRFADYALDADRNRLIAVCEDHSKAGQEPTNSIAAIDLDTGSVTQLASGHDFYSSPALSPDGNQLAFVAWSHPNMPWDDTFLYLAAFDEKGLLQEPK